MSFVALSAAQTETAQRLERREQELQRRERTLRHQMALSGLGPGSTSAAPPPRRNRSDVLRQAAAKRKMDEQSASEPLGYTPSRFREVGGPGVEEASTDVVDLETAAYLKAYAQESAAAVQKSAAQYCSRMSSQQHEQLLLAASRGDGGASARHDGGHNGLAVDIGAARAEWADGGGAFRGGRRDSPSPDGVAAAAAQLGGGAAGF
ncbi:hypothetical protein STCU_11536 [Strigomonas culicis]|uniref:Uncharacterized protein n=1 Tax=Strigomonas culicis TaxID=28005 RepID=S9TDQ2_9TRYP|nr:hypothetical protein STCU_11536 [Strigomonas culicis]|eukprot:EPY16132.1 hypothetical protein STCU_11536 [Strigomonas culicis]